MRKQGVLSVVLSKIDLLGGWDRSARYFYWLKIAYKALDIAILCVGERVNLR